MKNTNVISVFNIKALLSFTLFRGYTIRLFQSGDYEYLCKIYWLSGASGICDLFKYFIFKILTSIGQHNCLWCTIPSSKLAEPPSKRTPFPLRSLESLAEDHRKFLTQGKGNLKVAKLYNNVIGDTLFDIPLTNVDSTCLWEFSTDCGVYWKRPLKSWIFSVQ